MDTIDTALFLFQSGNAPAGLAACERILASKPDDLRALSLLGEGLLALGQSERAAAVLARVADLLPRDAAAKRRLGGVLLTLGRDDAAVDILEAAIRLEPSNPRGHNNFGQALLRLGRTAEAIASFQQALRIDPSYAIAHNNLGLAFARKREHSLAIQAFRQAIVHDQSLMTAHVNLASALESCDRLTEAATAYDDTLKLSPDSFDAWVGRGTVSVKLKRFESALQAFDRALQLRPHDPTASIQRAGTLLAMERAQESLCAIDQVLQIDDTQAPAWNVKAGALRRLNRRGEAAASLKTAVTLDPTDAGVWRDLSTVMHELGLVEDAVAAGSRAVALRPDDIQNRAQLLARIVPSVPDSTLQMDACRVALDVELESLHQWLANVTLSTLDTLTLARQQFFYLSYDERSNLIALQKYRGDCAARLAQCRDLQSEQAGQRNAPASRLVRAASASTRRFKLGFVSAHVHDHSVFHAILKGWLGTLDREQFEITVFSLGARQDEYTHRAAETVDCFVNGAHEIREWIGSIRKHDCDALIYPEIGMFEPTLALASLRLAHRQFVAWGHPETSGLPTMDGYLSAEVFEPREAPEHYTEPLICLPNLGVHYEPYLADDGSDDLSGLGLTRFERPLLIAAGVPFKYRPQHDWVWVDIARRLGSCSLIFFDYEIPELSRKLRLRLRSAFAAANLDADRYLIWLPWQPRPAFLALLRHADVYLDTIGFSGFNTVMQAIESGLPCVTYEGRFMRGRLGSGILRSLGLVECIASTPQSYADQAVRLARDPEYRAHIRTTIQRERPALYSDRKPVDALAKHLLRSVS